MNKILLILVFTVLSLNANSTTWKTAYPYTQRIDGQKVVIKAMPFDPSMGSPMLGETKVFYNKSLLYTIDKYYRKKIFTSNNGEYLAIVHTSNSSGISSFSLMGFEQINFESPAIEIFKNGKLLKTFTLKETIDTSRLLNNGMFFSWGYGVNADSLSDAEYECKICKRIYGRKVLSTCDTSEIYLSDCIECNTACEYAELKRKELIYAKNSIYVENNSLHILTNQGFGIRLSFETLLIERFSLKDFINTISNFNPPQLKRKYKKIRYPDKFFLPPLKNGKSIEQGLSELLNSKTAERDNATIQIYIHTLIINKNGNCESVYVSPAKRLDKETDFMGIADDEKLKAKIESWIMRETFDTSTLPRKFLKYRYSDFVYLK